MGGRVRSNRDGSLVHKKPIYSQMQLDSNIAGQTPHPEAWNSPQSTVCVEEIPPYISKRKGSALVIEPNSGYWEVVPERLAEMTAKEIVARAHLASIKAPDPATYDSDYYPLECVLYLTNKCNFSCTYCYSTPNRNANWANFNPRLLEKCIRMLFNESRRDSLCFLLFGGESLVAFDLMKHIVEYVKTLNLVYKKNITFRMQTNGSLINKDKAEYFRTQNIQVGISLDGPQEVHDKQRLNLAGKPTYQSVMKGIEILKGEGVPFSIIATIGDPEALPGVFEYFISEKLSSRIKVSPLLPEGAARARSFGTVSEYSQLWGEQNLSAARALIDHNKHSSFKIAEGNLSAMTTHACRDIRPDLCLRTPCGAVHGMVEFHPNGSLVTCDKTLYSEELGVVGNISEMSETDSLLELLSRSPLINKIKSRTADTIPKCSQCAVKRHCGGSCTLASYDFFKDFNREDVMCNYRKFMFEELMWLCAEDPLNAIRLTTPERVDEGF